jgi:hypothetical protein
MSVEPDDGLIIHDGRLSQAAAEIQRGCARLFKSLGHASVTELPLSNARRADMVVLGGKGAIWIVEIKSSIQDFKSDNKWPNYADYCDRLYFAVNQEFPTQLVPETCGLILADRYGAEIMRDPHEHILSGARRKAMLIRFARASALRLQGLLDPGPGAPLV